MGTSREWAQVAGPSGCGAEVRWRRVGGLRCCSACGRTERPRALDGEWPPFGTARSSTPTELHVQLIGVLSPRSIERRRYGDWHASFIDSVSTATWQKPFRAIVRCVARPTAAKAVAVIKKHSRAAYITGIYDSRCYASS